MRWDQGPWAQIPTSSPPWVSDFSGDALGCWKEECNVSEYDEEVTAESELKDIFHALSVRHHNKIIDPSTLIHQMALKHLKVKQKDVQTFMERQQEVLLTSC